ncbi:DUF5801 repeats-in-toxin domain-containing protein [Desulfomicrobium salsuginis]
MAETTQNTKQIVQAPQAGETIVIKAMPGQDIVLSEAFEQVDPVLEGSTVLFAFDNGGKVVIDFADLGEVQIPNIVLADGTMLGVDEFLASVADNKEAVLGGENIEPAAGPAAGGAASGGVGSYEDGAGDTIGGVSKLGGLDPRNFTTITVDSLEASPEPEIADGQPSASVTAGAVDEDGLEGRVGFNDGIPGGLGDHPTDSSVYSGSLGYDFGPDGPSATAPFSWNTGGLSAMGVTSQGNTVLYEVVDGGLTLNAYYIYGEPQGEAEGDYEYGRVEVFSVTVTDVAAGAFVFELYKPLDHTVSGTEDDIVYNIGFTITDGNGDAATGGLSMIVDDDSPVITLGGSELPTLILDESTTGSGIVESPQDTGNSNIANAISLDGHFTLGENADVANSGTMPFVSIHAVGNGSYDFYSFTVTQPGSVGVFDIDYGAGHGGSFDSIVKLYNSSGVQLVWSDDASVSYGGSGSTSGLDTFLTYNFSVPGTYYVAVGSYYDGPLPVGATYQLQLSLTDPVMGESGGSGDGIHIMSADFSGNFDYAYGADGPGDVDYALKLQADGDGPVASGLFAVDSSDTETEVDGYGQGAAILLSMEGDDIVGKVGGSDTVYFRITVNPDTGVVTFVQYENVWHANTENHDDASWLNTMGGTIVLGASVVDADGDLVTATLNLGDGVFAIEDDGPTLSVETEVDRVEAAALESHLDETVGLDRGADADGNTDDAGPGLGQVTTNVSGGLLSLFAAVGGDYGSDGAGTTVGALSFIGLPETGGLATTLSATDGGAISLEADGATKINGVDGDGDVVFTIEIVSVGDPAAYQLQTTLYEALDHGPGGNQFDSAVDLLLSGEGSVQLQYEVTRTDADGDFVTDSAAVDLVTNETSYFSFDDDGPTLSVEVAMSESEAAALESHLDETVGLDRGADADGNTDDAGPGLGQVTTNVSGGLLSLFAAVGGDYGSDGAGTTVGALSFIGLPETGGLATTLSATDGGAISLEADGATKINGVDGDGDVVFTIEIVSVGDPAAYQLQTTLYEALDHGPGGNQFDSAVDLLLSGEGSVQLQYEVTRTDADGDFVTDSAAVDLVTNETSYFSFDDDGPTLSVEVAMSESEAAALESHLDETVGLDRGADADGNTDDAGPGLGQVTTNVSGGLLSLFAAVGGDYGSDGAGTTVGALSFIGLPETGGLATTLSATDGGAISLEADGATKINGVDGDGDVVFTIEIVSVGDPAAYQLQTTLYEALDHGPGGNQFDSAVDLLLSGEGSVQLQYEVTRTDADGDFVTDSAAVDLVTNETSYFSFDDDGPTLSVEVAMSESEAAALESHLDETVGLDRGADADGNTDDAGPGLGQVTTNVSGGLLSLFAAVGGDYGSDGAGTTVGALSFIGLPETGGLATTLSATDGGAISLEADGATKINGVDGDGDVVFTIEIVSVGDPAAYQLQTTLYEALDHGPGGNQFDSAVDLLLSGEGSVQLQYEVTRTDADGDFVTDSAAVDLVTNETSYFSFDDDGPTLSVEVAMSESEAAALESHLDETVGLDRGADADGNTDDAGPGLGQVTTNVSGGLLSLFAAVGGDYGSDGAGTTVGALSFIGLPETGGLATTLSATDGGAISLEADGATKINGVDGDGDVVFTIEIVSVGDPAAYQLQTTLYEALDHGPGGNQFDSAVDLLLSGEGSVQLQYEVTRTDADGDFVTDSAAVDLVTNETSYFSFDDDGPTLSVEVAMSESEAAALESHLDETVGLDRGADADGNTDDAGPGLGQVTTNVSGGLLSLFAAVGGDYGSDGAGTTVGALSFIGLPETGGLATTLSATDGGAISLEADGATKINGVDGDGDVVFTIEIVSVGDPAAYQLQTTLYEALDHGPGGNQFDSAVDLLLSGEGSVQLQYEVTRTDADGDFVTDSAAVDLVTNETSYFSFDDDGPTLSVEVAMSESEAAALESHLDETVGLDRGADADGNTDDAGPGLGQVTTNVSGGLLSLFAAVGGDYGSDGAGTTVGALSFIGLPETGGLATTLSATDGGAISLEADGATKINGVDGDGDVVFTIEIVSVGDPAAYQLQTTLYEALDHGPGGNQFDSAVDLLLSGEGSVQLQYEVTRTDADGDFVTDSAAVDLVTNETSYFSFDDDGPTAGSTAAATLDDEGLAPHGIPGQGTGDVDGVLISTSGVLPHDFGSDTPGAVGFSAMHNQAGVVGAEAVTYNWDAGTNMLTAVSARGTVFTIEVTDPETGAYTLTLDKNVLHASLDGMVGDNTENDALVTLNYTVTDGDGDNVNGTLSLTFDDDMPVFTSAQAGEVDNVADEVFHGTLSFAIGADQPVPGGALSLIGNEAPADLSVGGLPVSYYVDPDAPNVLVAHTGGDPDIVANQVFTLVLNESGSYDFTLLKTIDNSTLVEIGSSTSFGAGPTGFQVLQDAGATQQLAVLSGWDWTGTPAQLQSWLDNGVLDPTLTTQKSVNGSTAGWGIGNNQFEGAEIFRIDFDDFDSYDSLVTDPGFNGPPVNFTTVDLINFADADKIAYVIHYTDGSFDSDSGTVLALAGDDNVMTLGEAGKFIDYIEFMDISGNGKFDVVNVSTVTPGDDIDLGFDFTVTDADGDTVSGSLDVTVNGYEVEPDPLLIVGSSVGDDQHSLADYTVGDGPGVITGDDADDILVGDPGGTRLVFEPGSNYNISLIVDSSGSMTAMSGTDGLSRMDLAKEALKHLVEQLAGHDGTVNLQLVDFDSGLTVNLHWADITLSDLTNIDAAIDNMMALGGTNYEAAFNASAEWFNSLSNGFENRAYFLTDGDPTYYLDDNGAIRGPGNTTDYDVMSNSLDAFVALSNVSPVFGIGIGSGVNEDYLKFFDNTDPAGSAAVPLTDVAVGSTVLADFSSSGGLNGSDAWTRTGDSTGNVAIASASGNSFLVVTDNTASASGPVNATSSSFTVNAAVDGSARLSFDYQTDNYSNSDAFTWTLQKNDGGGWTAVANGQEPEHISGWRGVEIDDLDNGMYRLVFSVLNGQGGGDLVRIDNIVVDYMETAHVGQPEIVNTAAELEAALQGGSSTTTVIDAGDDVIVGHDGNDLIFGDSVNTDALADSHSLTTPDGTGWGVFDSLGWDRQQVVDYLHSNHAALSAESGRDGGHDLIYAGLGNDTVYGQEGNDVMYGGLGNDSLNGGSGDDVLVGGPGADTMAGGAGSDTFAYLGGDLDGSVDQITDFHLGAGGDKIDVSDVLEGYTAGSDNSYFKFDNITIDTVNDTASIDLSVDVNGATGGQEWTPVAHVEIQNFTGTTDQDVVNEMLSHIVKPEMP